MSVIGDDLTKMRTPAEIADAALREELDRRLAECTEPQRAFFDRLYPGGVPSDKLANAVGLVQRTVIKNRAGDRAD